MTSGGALLEEKRVESSVAVKYGFVHFPNRCEQGRKQRRTLSCPPKIDIEGTGRARTVSTDASSTSVLTASEWVTTVMVRNIPTRFTSVSLLGVLDEAGFGGTYSFFYLPMDFRTGKNMGYCFINFMCPEFAHMFANIFNGTRLGVTTSSKVLQVSASRRQGLKANVALFRGSDLLSSHSLPFFKPFVLVAGELLPLCTYLFDLIMAYPDEDL